MAASHPSRNFRMSARRGLTENSDYRGRHAESRLRRRSLLGHTRSNFRGVGEKIFGYCQRNLISIRRRQHGIGSERGRLPRRLNTEA